MPAKSKKTSNKSAQSGPISKPVPISTNSQRPAAQGAGSPHHIESTKSPQLEPDSRTGDTTESAGEPTPVPIVNRKKQKRREKEAAKRTAGQHEGVINGGFESQVIENGQLAAVKQGRVPVKGYFTEETDYIDPDFQDHLAEAEEEFYSNDEDIEYAHNYPEGPDNSWLNTSKRKKSSRKRSHQQPIPINNTSSTQKPFPTLSNAALRSAHKMSNSNDHIWNTSTQAERENIKQFWLELGEDERRSLVRVEKEAVLRKMKEQQKHSCSCSVCGRKRTAIEEELEVLYDAYYQELEQFANHNNEIPESPQSLAPPRTIPVYRPQHPMAGAYPAQGQIHDLDDDAEDLDDEDEDEYDDDEDEDEDEDAYSDEEYDDELPPGPANFYQFGNSLTVKDGILTVADDLLKNDGKHFIDMMEQLAERRMQREEEIHYPAPPLAHQSLRQGHNHPPIDDDDDYDEEDDDEDYDSQEEDDFEGDEMDSMTEEQRMEEGRRMFQIFAARMFEQRVLTAYKEKVAHERQQKLLEELEEEVQKDTQREAKKAKEAAKKKEKKARQKAAKDEEKAKREAEKASQEAAAREEEERKAAEKRLKQEEQRKKRDEERKAVEQERAKKEAEKVQRAQKERERQLEAEKKAKEAKEREKKQREEQRKKEREERELKEAEARERRLKEEQERKEREAQQRREREAAAKAEREARKSEQAARPQPIALPPGLHPPTRNTHVPSPHPVVATPVIPTPNRSRQPSQPSQQSHSSSPRSQKASTEASQTSISPANAVVPQPPGIIQQPKNTRQGPPLHHPQPSAPRSPLHSLGRGNYMHGYGGMQGLGVNGTSIPGGHPNIPAPMHMYQGPPMIAGQRFPSNGMHLPPGINAPRPFQTHQHIPYHQPPPGPGPAVIPQQPAPAAPMHSRQLSGSETAPPPAPIARPGPIARPLSTTPDKPRGEQFKEDVGVERITTQLGSSALLDDSDEPFASQLDTRQHPTPLGAPGTGRMPFASSFINEKPAAFGMGSSNWGSSFNNLHGGHFGQVGHRGAAGWPQPLFDPMRPHVPRPIAVRLMLVQACRQLTALSGGKGDGYHPAREILRQVEQIKPPGDASVSMDEMLGICDTEGNVQNGGGTFEVMIDHVRGQIVKFVDDNTGSLSGRGMGDIGGPIAAPGHQVSSFGSIGQGVQHQHQGFGPPGSRNF